MLPSSLSSALVSFALLSSIVACGQAGAGQPGGAQVKDDESSEKTTAEPGVFAALNEPGGLPNQGCSIGVRLVIDRAELSGNVAFLSNFVNGLCEIAVEPNERHYILKSVERGACGSTVMKGETDGFAEKRSIEIVDHRTRTCRDLVPARVIFKETRTDLQSGGSITTEWFSMNI